MPVNGVERECTVETKHLCCWGLGFSLGRTGSAVRLCYTFGLRSRFFTALALGAGSWIAGCLGGAAHVRI